jgi:hypothetical protein
LSERFLENNHIPDPPNSMKATCYMNRTNTFSLSSMALVFAAMFLFALSASATSFTWNDPGGNSGNWSTATNWNPNALIGGPETTDTVVFGNADEPTSLSTANNTVDSGSAGIISTLTYNDFENSGAYVYPVTLIPTGKTLLVTNSFLVGGLLGTSTGTPATYAYFYGGGTLKVTGPSLLVMDASSSGQGPCAYLNLSGLTNFIYNNPKGSFGVATNGGPLGTGSSATRVGGSMTLAYSNNITVGVMNLSAPSLAAAQGGPNLMTSSYGNFGTEPNGVQGSTASLASGFPEELVLGPGTNIINAGAINIAANKNGFIITNSGGGLRIRGVTGADSDANVNISVGIRNPGGGSGQTTGWLLLDGCPVNIKANNLILGDHLADAPQSAGAGGNGLLEFDTGTISANSLLMADNVANNNGTHLAVASGMIMVGPNATFNIGAGQTFALATAALTGPAAGFLIVSDGVMNCQGPIVMGANTNSVPSSSPGFASGIIQLIGSGTLNMGANSYVGTATNPITGLLLDTNSVFSLSIPSANYTNVCVDSLAWPSPDTNLTLSVAAIPTGITNGELFPFLSYTTLTNSIIVVAPNYINFTNNNATFGSFTNPKFVLPIGVTGNMFASNNNVIYFTLTSGTGIGYGGVPQLTNGFFIQGSPYWAASGVGATIVSSNSDYPNAANTCLSDNRNIVPMPGTGANVAQLTGSFVAGGSTNTWSQTVPVTVGAQLAPGAQVTLGASTYVAHEDVMSGADSFYYEVDFLDGNNNVLAAYESGILTNLNCSSPGLDTWFLMGLTNVMQVTGGVNTGVVASTSTNAIYQVPAGSVTAQFKAKFIQANATDTGSVYFSGANIGFLLAPVSPVVSSISPNLVTLCTNQFLSCTVTSAITTISSFAVTATTTTLGGTATNTTTYNMGSPSLSFNNLGTASATVNFALAPNTIYQSVSVIATDADNLAVSSSSVSFDTLTPVLVIEACDFNYSSGQFIDTSSNGGFALYQGKVGTQSIDENKIARAGTQSYYRPSDATYCIAAAPTSGTEQKFVTAAANGDTTDIQVAIGSDTNGDWANYSRTYATSGTYSAQPGTYNVWCSLATSGSGPQVALYQVTSNPALSNQTTNFLGNFGGTAFSDNSYFNYVYTPLVDQFGNRVTVSIANGVQTFGGQIINGDTPNVAFYMLTPVVPILNPVFLYVNPDGPFEPTNMFTFVVGPAQGALISSNGIGITLNGVAVTSGVSFASFGTGGWTVTLPIQSNNVYSVVINVTNLNGITASYVTNFDTFTLSNYHWMAVDYDFSTNNGTGTTINDGQDGTGGSVGDGWTGGLFIDNPVPTGDSGAAIDDQTYQFSTNSYFGYPTGIYPAIDPSKLSLGAQAQQSIDINWPTNLTQDPGLTISNSVYRLSPNGTLGDGVGTQVASDTFLMPEFLMQQTNTLYGADNTSGGPDANICEFNVGYFYSGDWLNYTRNYPSGTFNLWGRLSGGGGAFSGCTLSQVTSGVGTSNQATTVLGTFSDANPAGWQTYHWVELLDTNSNPVYLQLSGKATFRLTAPTNATTSGNGLNPLFFMLTPTVLPLQPFSISVSKSGTNVEISIPTQSQHTYMLWQAATLKGTYTQVGGNITGNGSVQTIPEPISNTQSYYKVIGQ